MSLFRDRLGTSTSYIHRIEQGLLVPELERATKLGEVFRDIAREQGAHHPDADVRALLHAREVAVIVDEHGVDEAHAKLVLFVRDARPEKPGDERLRELLGLVMTLPADLRGDLLSALGPGASLLLLLTPEQRSGAIRNLELVSRRLMALAPDARLVAIMRLAEAMGEAVDSLQLPGGPPAENPESAASAR